MPSLWLVRACRLGRLAYTKLRDARKKCIEAAIGAVATVIARHHCREPAAARSVQVRDRGVVTERTEPCSARQAWLRTGIRREPAASIGVGVGSRGEEAAPGVPGPLGGFKPEHARQLAPVPRQRQLERVVAVRVGQEQREVVAPAPDLRQNPFLLRSNCTSLGAGLRVRAQRRVDGRAGGRSWES